jgi:hypothetical protein
VRTVADEGGDGTDRVASLVDGVEYVYTVGMDADEVETRLRAAATGVLALADDGRAYAIPVSIHLADGRVYLRLSDEGGEDESRKLAFVETTEEAALVCYGFESERESWSVLVEGPLRPVEDADVDAATVNEEFGPLRVFDEAVDEVELHLYELQPTSITGRRTLGTEPEE